MQHKYYFEAVYCILADVYANNLHPFGSVSVVLGCDFTQILPVVHNGSQEAIVNVCIQRSFLWLQLRWLTLQQNMRVCIGEDNHRFAQWVSSLPYDTMLHNRISLLASII